MAALSAASIFTSSTLSSTFLPPTSLSVSAARFSSARGKILNVLLSYDKKVLQMPASFLSLVRIFFTWMSFFCIRMENVIAWYVYFFFFMIRFLGYIFPFSSVMLKLLLVNVFALSLMVSFLVVEIVRRFFRYISSFSSGMVSVFPHSPPLFVYHINVIWIFWLSLVL